VWKARSSKWKIPGRKSKVAMTDENKCPDFWLIVKQKSGKKRYIGYSRMDKGGVLCEAIALQKMPEIDSVKVLEAVPATTYRESVHRSLWAIAQ
jgi:hypothetical protein